MESNININTPNSGVDNGPSQESVLTQLKSSYEMYERTKKETRTRMKEALNSDGTKKYTEQNIKDQLKLIEHAQKEIVKQYVLTGGKEEDIKKRTRTKSDKNLENRDYENLQSLMEMMKDDGKKEIPSPTETYAVTQDTMRINQDYMPNRGNDDIDEAYDIIPLPSKGEGYKEKIGKVAVAYLTAYDENMIVSPNLYRDNLILDYMINEKLLSKEIDPMDLLECDREAIILFLRASGYGNEYPITATDNLTGKEFSTSIDLSTLKYKDFTLKGDTNGWFSFTLPVSKKEIKFRYPTHRDNVMLEKLQEAETAKAKKSVLENYVETMDLYIEKDESMESDVKARIRKAIREIERWADSISEENSHEFSHTLTNRLNLLIMSVDGITDKRHIFNFIKRMNVKDSMALRKYMTNNEPGIDYNLTIERPESLGGGSFTTFLQLDQFIFLNIPE